MTGFRRNVAAVLGTTALAFGIASAAQAQPAPEGMHGQAHEGGWHRGDRHGGHGGEMRRAFRALNLSEAQRDQIFKIHHDQAPAFREQMKKVRASRDELRKLAMAERYDEAAVRRAADAQGKASSDLAVMRVQTMNKVRAVLTPEQKARLAQMHEQRQKGPAPR